MGNPKSENPNPKLTVASNTEGVERRWRSPSHDPSSFIPHLSSPRSGLTLVELLVVIVLLMILTAVAIPVLAPNVEQRRIREAARMVSLFISGARTRAIELGRPVGVQFERLAGNPNASMVLTYVEVPAPYSGDSLGSQTRITVTSATVQNPTQVYFQASMPAGDCNNRLIRVGDFIKFNFQGRDYQITGPDGVETPVDDDIVDDPASGSDPVIVTFTYVMKPGESMATIAPWATWNGTTWGNHRVTPYQIARQPIKASDMPLQLPEGAVVDLSLSGTTSAGFEFNTSKPSLPASGPLTLLFTPGGSLVKIYYSTTAPSYTPLGPAHLLVGRSDGVGVKDADFPDPTRSPWNLRDMNNVWVSIGVQTGLVTTTENTRVATTPITTFDATYDQAIRDSRTIAGSFQSMGGR